MLTLRRESGSSLEARHRNKDGLSPILKGGYKLLFSIAACALLAFTFTYPSAVLLRDAYRVLVVLDITQSMNTLDRSLAGKPISRLDFAKEIVRDTLRDLPCGSEVALGVFTEYRSFLLLSSVEVCANYQELTDTLRMVNSQMAWAGGSEIVKGLNSALRLLKDLDPQPVLIFVSDGHEAPPLHPQHRPRLDESQNGGAIVGVGASQLSPIPKYDPGGKLLGVWQADEVLQTDTYSLGRAGSGESMVDSEGRPIVAQRASGTEHLSSLKEAHLELLAAEAHMAYERLDSSKDLKLAIAQSGATHPLPIESDLRWILAAAALFFLVASRLPLRRLRRT